MKTLWLFSSLYPAQAEWRLQKLCVQCEGPVPRPTGFSCVNPDPQPQIGSPTLCMTPLPTPSQPAPDTHRTYRIFWTTSPGLSLYPSLVTLLQWEHSPMLTLPPPHDFRQLPSLSEPLFRHQHWVMSDVTFPHLCSKSLHPPALVSAVPLQPQGRPSGGEGSYRMSSTGGYVLGAQERDGEKVVPTVF